MEKVVKMDRDMTKVVLALLNTFISLLRLLSLLLS